LGKTRMNDQSQCKKRIFFIGLTLITLCVVVLMLRLFSCKKEKLYNDTHDVRNVYFHGYKGLKMTDLRNVHPGEVLAEEFLNPLGVSQTKAARDMGVSPRRINEIVLGKRSITADTSLRLALYFGTSEHFWLGLQEDYALEEARKINGKKIKETVKPLVIKMN